MTRYSPIDADTLDAIAAAGFDVYQPVNGVKTYGYFTDGTRIGYIQRTAYFDCYETSTVHIPNKTTGTGFGLEPLAEITRESLTPAFMTAPSWASTTDRESVRKYKDWDAFNHAQRIVPLERVRTASMKEETDA